MAAPARPTADIDLTIDEMREARRLLAALELRPAHGGHIDRGADADARLVVVDPVIYEATGNAHLATLFSAAA